MKTIRRIFPLLSVLLNKNSTKTKAAGYSIIRVGLPMLKPQ